MRRVLMILDIRGIYSHMYSRLLKYLASNKTDASCRTYASLKNGWMLASHFFILTPIFLQTTVQNFILLLPVELVQKGCQICRMRSGCRGRPLFRLGDSRGRFHTGRLLTGCLLTEQLWRFKLSVAFVHSCRVRWVCCNNWPPRMLVNNYHSWNCLLKW